MAEPLLSLMTPGTMKHVVPWRSRSDFLAVYQDLYSSDSKAQESAVGRIISWKARAGSKLSVAIESSGTLMEARLQHMMSEKEGRAGQDEHKLRYSYSMAIIRFVNHITEKAQTKAVAQPVHLVAREFGIPEWIVRLRHDATHGSLPCLNTLSCAAQWCLDYLQYNFWEQQKGSNLGSQVEGKSSTDTDIKLDSSGQSKGDGGSEDRLSSATAQHVVEDTSVICGDIRTSLKTFQIARFQKFQHETESQGGSNNTAVVRKLESYMYQNRQKFINCLLEDGFLIGTEEQLLFFGADPDDLTIKPTIPLKMALFWRPILKSLSNCGALPFLLRTALFSVSSDKGLRNAQLVAWVAFLLANTTHRANPKRNRKRLRKSNSFLSTSQPISTRLLLTVCLQNLNKLTVHLLKHLMDKESLGDEVYTKLSQLINPTYMSEQEKNKGGLSIVQQTDDDNDDDDDDDEGASCTDSESDAMDSVHDPKNGHSDKNMSENLLDQVQAALGQNEISWNLCTDAVDWSTIPLGVLPDFVHQQDEEKHGTEVSQHKSSGRQRRRGEDNDDEDDEDSDIETDSHPKRSKLIVTEDLLL